MSSFQRKVLKRLKRRGVFWSKEFLEAEKEMNLRNQPHVGELVNGNPFTIRIEDCPFPSEGSGPRSTVSMPCDIPMFDSNSHLKPNPNINNIGPKESGKTTLTIAQMIMSEAPKFLVMCGSAFNKDNNAYCKVVDKDCVFKDFNEEVLWTAMDTQKELVRKYNLNFPDMQSNEEKRRAMRVMGLCIVLDDLSHKKDIYRDDVMRELMYDGKHMGIFLIINTHYTMCVDHAVRDQIEYVFAMKDGSHAKMKSVFENFFTSIATFNLFKSIYRPLTSSYRAMVKIPSNSWIVGETTCWLKADKVFVDAFKETKMKLDDDRFIMNRWNFLKSIRKIANKISSSSSRR
jgi:hypothetical protein